jgi:hypothetical protein
MSTPLFISISIFLVASAICNKECSVKSIHPLLDQEVLVRYTIYDNLALKSIDAYSISEKALKQYKICSANIKQISTNGSILLISNEFNAFTQDLTLCYLLDIQNRHSQLYTRDSFYHIKQVETIPVFLKRQCEEASFLELRREIFEPIIKGVTFIQDSPTIESDAKDPKERYLSFEEHNDEHVLPVYDLKGPDPQDPDSLSENIEHLRYD